MESNSEPEATISVTAQSLDGVEAQNNILAAEETKHDAPESEI